MTASFRTVALPLAFGAVCVAALATETYVVFFDRNSAFSIHGVDEYSISGLEARQRVRHAFLMNGDGLQSVSVLVSGKRGVRTTLKWIIWRGTPDAPLSMMKAGEGLDTFELHGRREWRTFPMIRDGSSHDRWYTVEVAIIDLSPSDGVVSIVASRDNPDRGGVLWVESTRRAGSLVLRANRLGRTPYQRFRLEAEKNLPPVLRSGTLQWFFAAVYHAAFVLVAYAFIRSAAAAAPFATLDRRPYVAVISLQPADATTTLFFGHLRDRLAVPLRIVGYRSPDLAQALGGASAIVIVRALFEFPAVARFARYSGTPISYFLDDNFMVLREEGGPAAKFVTGYSVSAVRASLQTFSRVLLATAPLLKYFRDHDLHHALHLFPPCAGSKVSGLPAARTLTMAFFGGTHLHDAFHGQVLPAVRRLAEQREVKLIVVGVAGPIEPSRGLSIVRMPYFNAYRDGIARLAGERVDVLLHPVAAGPNSVYKNPHALITASVLDAVPVVSRRVPYDDVDAGVALLAEDSVESWLQQLTIAADPEHRASILAHLRDYCAVAFSGSLNAALLTEMLNGARRPGAPARWWRTAVARAFIAGELVRRLSQRGRASGTRQG